MVLLLLLLLVLVVLIPLLLVLLVLLRGSLAVGRGRLLLGCRRGLSVRRRSRWNGRLPVGPGGWGRLLAVRWLRLGLRLRWLPVALLAV